MKPCDIVLLVTLAGISFCLGVGITQESARRKFAQELEYRESEAKMWFENAKLWHEMYVREKGGDK